MGKVVVSGSFQVAHLATLVLLEVALVMVYLRLMCWAIAFAALEDSVSMIDLVTESITSSCQLTALPIHVSIPSFSFFVASSTSSLTPR